MLNGNDVLTKVNNYNSVNGVGSLFVRNREIESESIGAGWTFFPAAGSSGSCRPCMTPATSPARPAWRRIGSRYFAFFAFFAFFFAFLQI